MADGDSLAAARITLKLYCRGAYRRTATRPASCRLQEKCRPKSLPQTGRAAGEQAAAPNL